MLLVTAMLALLPRVWRGLRTLPLRLVAGYAGIGALVALHWLTFYGAVKLANASVAATCIALAPVFTSIIEPWVAKRPFQLRELAFAWRCCRVLRWWSVACPMACGWVC